MKKIRILVSVLLFLIAIPIGLWFILYDNRFGFNQLLPYRGFWLSWGSSTGVTFMALASVEYLTRLLHRHRPWRGDRYRWAARLAMQLSLGFVLPLSLVWAWNAGFFHGSGQTLRLDGYASSEFRMAAILLVVFNALCCVVLVTWDRAMAVLKRRALDSAAKEREQLEKEHAQAAGIPEKPTKSKAAAAGIPIPELAVRGAYVEVNRHQCTVYLLNGGQEGYTIKMDTLAGEAAGPELCRIHRKYIVNRRAILDVELNRKTHEYFVCLNGKYAGHKLPIGPTYLDDFLKWVS